jgi:DNA recombination protein RmuC
MILVVINLIVTLVLLKRRAGDSAAIAQAEAEDRAETARLLREELRASREEASAPASELRREVSGTHQASTDGLVKTISQIGDSQTKKFEAFTLQLKGLTDSNQAGLKHLQETVDGRLQELRSSNERKLDQMREVVDEKLQSTLEKRLGESFKLVGDRLEAVQKGLGEMRSLASGVGDLKKVLTKRRAPIRATSSNLPFGCRGQARTPTSACGFRSTPSSHRRITCGWSRQARTATRPRCCRRRTRSFARFRIRRRTWAPST